MSALKSLMLPSAETKEIVCQLELGPDQRFQVWPATLIPESIWEPTGSMLKNRAEGQTERPSRRDVCAYPPSPESQIMLCGGVAIVSSRRIG